MFRTLPSDDGQRMETEMLKFRQKIGLPRFNKSQFWTDFYFMPIKNQLF